MVKILAHGLSGKKRKANFLLALMTAMVSLSWTCPKEEQLFELLSPGKTGISFKNQLTEDEKTNILTYEYFYNGGGVAVGDINNDGLDDIFFTANMEKNKLYLNEGHMKFKDITKSAHVEGKKQAWTTGVTMADVNGDGLLDIYVCYSGRGNDEARKNELYINQGNRGSAPLQFEEKAAAYGLDDPSYSTQAAFFDFDKDGDLDMFLLNHNITVINGMEFDNVRNTRDPLAGDKLYENDHGRFVDISEKAGIKGSPLGFGLGLAIADVNGDGLQDIYVSNDYIEPDYLYINNGKGADGSFTFTDKITDYLQHISHFSMGSEVTDMNNDGHPDIYTLDMLPHDNERQKLLYGPENYEQYALMVMKGYYLQNMRNMLQVNNGNDPDGHPTFSEIGQLAGISNTDWSWAPLFADFDNDGWKDLFISNGYYRDYTNRDFLKYKGDYYFQKAINKEKADTFHLVNGMTSTPVHNYIFRNNHDLTFTDMSSCWAFDDPVFSNGAAYSDLDNDGDLDLVVNNLNAHASVFKNLTREKYPDHKYLSIVLKGQGKNTAAIGSKVYVYTSAGEQYYECMPTRGFQSAVSNKIHVGVGNVPTVDSVSVIWMSGKMQVIKNVTPNQILTIEEKPDLDMAPVADVQKQCVFSKVPSPVQYQHQEYGSNDFKRQPLLMTMLTTCGPVMATADVNHDQLTDVFVGGAKGSLGKVFIQTANGQFTAPTQHFDHSDMLRTDADAVFFDADGDQDEDLYIASGGYNDYQPHDLQLQDRLYLNDGKGNFEISAAALPVMLVSKSCVKPCDFDQDGDIDLFIGSRVIPGEYPAAPQSYLLENDGSGPGGEPHFTDVMAAKIPGLVQAGMITDAAWTDIDKDGHKDLIVIGEYMPIKVYLNKGGQQFTDATDQYFDQPLAGLWCKLLLADFDNDGDEDVIAGNFGLNSQLKVSQQEPLSLVYKDFDSNGSIDPIMTYYIQGKPYPFASRDELLDQIYGMRKKFTTYAAYADAQLTDIFSKEELQDATVLKAETLETVYLENKNNKLVPHPLPTEAQFAPVYALSALDYNHDGNLDLLIAGNQSAIRIRMGVIDANFGQLFKGDGHGNFTYIPQTQSGLEFKGDIKSLKNIQIQKDAYLLVGVNNVGLESYKLNRP